MMETISATLDIGVIAVTMAAAMLVAWYAGRKMGARLTDGGGAKPSKFDDASMALLGLLIAFTFGMSIERHDQRRMAVVADSNAIGDFYTCASLLREPTRAKLQAVIRQYAQLRLDFARGPAGEAELQNALAKFSELHMQMTKLVDQALGDGTPIAISLANTLNGVISNQAARLAAYRERLPDSIVVLLFASAIGTALLIGREQGTAGVTDVAGTICFVLLVSIALFVILDLNRPEQGWIRASQEPIVRLITSITQ